MSSGSYGLVHVALHQTQLLQPLAHQTADGKVHIFIFYARLGHLEHIVVALLHDAVDIQLALCELTVDGHCAGVVGTVVVELAACVADDDAP